MKTRTKLLATAVLAASSFNAYSAPLHVELKQLLNNHPLIKAGQSASKGAEDSFGSSVAELYPKIALSAGIGNETIKNRSLNVLNPTGTGGWSDPVENGNDKGTTSMTAGQTYSDMSITMTQPLYKGGALYAGIERAYNTQLLKDANLAATTQDAMLEGIVAYLQVARFQTLIKLAEQNEKSTLAQLELESKRVARGGGIAVDANQANTRLQVVKERKVYYRQMLREVLANYEQVFGRAAELNNMDEVLIPEELLPTNIDFAMDRNLSTNPQVLAALRTADIAANQAAATQANELPSIDFVSRFNNEFGKSSSYHKQEISTGIQLSWTFSLGGLYKKQSDAALAYHDEQVQKAAAAKNRYTESVRKSWNQVLNGKERLELLQSAAEISKQVMEDRKKLRDAGKETALSALDAEVEYYGVLANKVNAKYDTKIASFKVLSSLGKLSPDALGLNSGTFAVPVKPLVVDAGSI
jgi:outer membrane protein TolC